MALGSPHRVRIVAEMLRPVRGEGCRHSPAAPLNGLHHPSSCVAYRVPISARQHLTQSCPVLAEACLKVASAPLCQTVRTAACKARNSVAERFDHWLRIADDRVDGPDLCITHQVPPNSLGVCRYNKTTIPDRAGLKRQTSLSSDTATRKSFAQGANGWNWLGWHPLARPLSQP